MVYPNATLVQHWAIYTSVRLNQTNICIWCNTIYVWCHTKSCFSCLIDVLVALGMLIKVISKDLYNCALNFV